MLSRKANITIQGETAIIDKPVVLYRGDRNIKVKFTITENPYSSTGFFRVSKTNVIEENNISYGRLVIKRENGLKPLATDIAATEEGAIILTIKKEMIDEIAELGAYDFHLVLYNENKSSKATLPAVEGGIIVKEPIEVINETIIGGATVEKGEDLPVFDSSGNYIKNNWEEGVLIDSGKMNKIEKAIYKNNSQIKEIETDGVRKETVEAKVQSVIDEKISDGTMANLTIADNSLPASKLVDNSITLNEISQYEIIGNLYDTSMITSGKGINDKGEIIIVEWEMATIPVKPNTTYIYYNNKNEYANSRMGNLAFANDKKAITSSYNMADLPTGVGEKGKYFTTSSDTSYVLVNVNLPSIGINVRNSTILLEGNIIPDEIENSIVNIFGKNLADYQGRKKIKTLSKEIFEIKSNITCNIGDNTNYGLVNTTSNDYYSNNLTQLKPCSNEYLKDRLGVENWFEFKANEGINGGNRRDLFYKNKYDMVIKSKHYQILYYFSSNSGQLDDRLLNTHFVANGSSFKAVYPEELIVTQVGDNLWQVRSSGVIPDDNDYDELWIGSSFVNGYVSDSLSLDLCVGGFYCKVSDTSLVGSYEINPILPNFSTRDEFNMIKNDIKILKDKVGSKYYFDKNIVIMGDSITANPNWWTKNMLERLSFKNYLNLARSGATWSHTADTIYDITATDGNTSSDNVIWNQVNKLIAKVNNEEFPIPDVVFILAGTNDYSRDKGNVSNTFVNFTGDITQLDPGEITDLVKGIRYSCETVLNNFPDVQLILATPIQRGLAHNNTIFEIGDLIKECGRRLSASVIDQGSECGIYGYYEYTGDKYLYDNLHPNDKGNEKIGSFIATKLKSIICV